MVISLNGQKSERLLIRMVNSPKGHQSKLSEGYWFEYSLVWMVNSRKRHCSEWSIVGMIIGPNGQQSEGSLVQLVYSPKGH